MNPISRIRVRVPATTSNLGPGFDCLGLALGLYNELTLERYPEPGDPAVEIEGEGQGALPRDRQNLMVHAANLVIAGKTQDRLVFRAKNLIPLARGLGSSAAAAVAGLFAANALFDPPPLGAQELFQYATLLEGHPDNAAAAIWGGLVVSLKDGRGTKPLALKPHAGLCAVVCVPELELETAKARAALPPTVLREQAVENIARALVLSSALERGRFELLAEAMGDSLHQPYRAPLVPGFNDVLRAARAAGPCGAALSGAGSSILALCRKGPGARRIGAAMEEAFRRHGVESRGLILPLERRGVRVKSLGMT